MPDQTQIQVPGTPQGQPPQQSLGQILKQLAINLPAQLGQNVGNAMMSIGTPDAFNQQQENLRQQRQLQQQQSEFQQQLGMRQQEYANQLQWHTEEVQRQKERDNNQLGQWLLTNSDKVQEADGPGEGVQQFGTRFFKGKPLDDQMSQWTYRTPPDMLQQGFPDHITMPSKEAPEFIGKIATLRKLFKGPEDVQSEGNGLKDLVAQSVHDPDMVKFYHNWIDGLIAHPGEKPSDEFNKVRQDLNGYLKENTPAAKQAKVDDAAKKASAVWESTEEAKKQNAYKSAPAVYKSMVETGMTPDIALGRMGGADAKKYLMQWMQENNKPFPTWLTDEAQKSRRELNTADTLRQSLIKTLEAPDPANPKQPLYKNNTPFTQLAQRAEYAVGMNTPLASLMNREEVFRPLAGGRIAKAAGVNALEFANRAMIHTPNAAIDSPALAYQKLKDIGQFFKDSDKSILKYGNRWGMQEAPGAAEPPVDPNQFIK